MCLESVNINKYQRLFSTYAKYANVLIKQPHASSHATSLRVPASVPSVPLSLSRACPPHETTAAPPRPQADAPAAGPCCGTCCART
eukprot:6096897-Prymnesium_polylepis.1